MSDAEPTTEEATEVLRQRDSELVAGAMAGSAAAFEAIVRSHNRLLFRTARGLVTDDEAQDVVQETYLRALTRLHAYRGEAALGTWLARIAINVALDVLRRRGRTEPFDTGDYDERGADTLLHVPEGELPDAQADRHAWRALLEASIDELPPIYRSVFILRAVEEMNVAEAAWCLGVSNEVVKTRFLRARALLRERIATRIVSGARDTFGFAGARCDAVLAQVMDMLHSLNMIRADDGAPTQPRR